MLIVVITDFVYIVKQVKLVLYMLIVVITDFVYIVKQVKLVLLENNTSSILRSGETAYVE